MDVEQVPDGVCAPRGFVAAGVHCGIATRQDKNDLALIFSKAEATAAAVYTRNEVKAAPVFVTQANLNDGRARAVICNSGNANACNADGEQVALEMCALAAKALNIAPQEVIVASTGVIGQRLDINHIKNGVSKLSAALSEAGGSDAAHAIMTTDTAVKEIAVSFTLSGKECKIGGIAKGSGMIHPNMATMLAFLTTDAAISSEMLQKALSGVVRNTFNMISVDGDTSTNDMACVIANGLAGNAEITEENEDFEAFSFALMYCCIYLARMMAKDGEGATRLIECVVDGAPGEDAARTLAKSVISSSLVKTAVFGADANWGRVLCALGYAGVSFDPKKIWVKFKSAAGEIIVCENGAGVDFDEKKAKEILSEEEIEIIIPMNQGNGTAVAWGCDFSYDYVKINGDYRT